MPTLTDKQVAIWGLVMFGSLLLSIIVHVIYRRYTVRKYDQQLAHAGCSHHTFDIFGGRIFLYMRAALTPQWFDRMQRRQQLFDPALLKPVITPLDKLLMVAQLVLFPLFIILLTILAAGQ